MIINDLDDYYIVFDTKNRNTELDTLIINIFSNNLNFNTMKRFILMLAVVMLAVLGVNAQTEKTLKGKLTNVQMNNNNYADVEGVTFILTDNGDGTGTLESEEPIGPIGKMPGAINVNMAVAIDSKGGLSAKEDSKAGVLDLNIGGPVTLYTTSLTGDTTTFVLKTKALSVFGKAIFNASVTFVAE